MAKQRTTSKKTAAPALPVGVADTFKATGHDAVYLHTDGTKWYFSEARALLRFGEGNFEKVDNPFKE